MNISTLVKNLTLTLLSILCFFSITFAQPYRLEVNFGSGWQNYVLEDRSVTMAITVQSYMTNPTAGFLFNNVNLDWNPKWCGSNAPDVTRPINSYLSGAAYIYSSGGWDADFEVSVIETYYYTFIIGKNVSANNDMSVLETSYNPISISLVDVSQITTVFENDPVNVPLTLSGSKDSAQKVFLRYTTDNWATSNFIEITTFDGSNIGNATISGVTAGTTVIFYALTTNQNSLVHATADYFTLNLNNNTGSNYTYSVVAAFSAEIFPDSILHEYTLNQRSLTLVLHNDTFADATLAPGNFTLNNIPDGTSIEGVTYVNMDTAIVSIAFNGTDFDSDSTHFSITIAGLELGSGTDLTSNELTILGVNEVISEGIDYGVIAVDTGAGIVYMNDTIWDGANLGTYNSSQMLTLNSGQLFVWKNQASGGNITSCNMYYRLYKDGDVPGAFIQQYLPWQSEWNGGDNQLWWNDSPEETNFDVLAATTSAGTWNIELYFEAHNGETQYLLDNGGLNYTAQFSFEAVTSVLIAADSALVEPTLDDRSIIVILQSETFADTTLSASNFHLNDLPSGSEIEGVTYVSPDTAIVQMSFDGSDFDGYYFTSLTIIASELTGGNSMISNNLLIYPVTDDTCPFAIDLGNDTSICGGNAIVLNPGVMISPFGDSLTLFYDATTGLSGLQGAAKVYMHAGAELHTGGGWQYTTGSWGADDGIGLMVEVAPDLWKITINPVNYFGYPADSSLLGIFLKFRNEDGTLEGADDTGQDIWMDFQNVVCSFVGVTPYFMQHNLDSVAWTGGSTGNSLIITQSGTYIATVLQQDGCSDSDTIIVSLGNLPLVNVSNDTVVCAATTLQVISGGFSTYEWLMVENDSLISSDSSATITKNGLYRLNVTNDAGCVGFDVFIVEFKELPFAGFTIDLQQNLVINFADSSLYADSYSWDFDGDNNFDSFTSGDNSYTYSAEGQYNVLLEVSNVCGSDTYSQLVIVTELGVGVTNNDGNWVRIYPNPVNGTVYFDHGTASNDIRVNIINCLGKKVYSEIVSKGTSAGTTLIPLNSIAEGLYYVQVLSENSTTVTYKLIVE